MRVDQPNILVTGGLRFLLHDIFGNGYDGFVDIEAGLGADLEPVDTIVLQKFNLFFIDFGLVTTIALVDKTKDSVLGRVLFGLFDPVGDHIVEGFGGGVIVYQNDGIGPFVV